MAVQFSEAAKRGMLQALIDAKPIITLEKPVYTTTGACVAVHTEIGVFSGYPATSGTITGLDLATNEFIFSDGRRERAQNLPEMLRAPVRRRVEISVGREVVKDRPETSEGAW